MTEEIKDCPFCGKQPVIEQTGRMKLKLCCKSCVIGIEQKAIRYDLDWLRGKIIERWNKRFTSEQLTAAEARLSELQAELLCERSAVELKNNRIKELEEGLGKVRYGLFASKEGKDDFIDQLLNK